MEVNMSQFSRKQFIVAGTSAVLAVAVTTLLRAHPAAAQNPSPGSAPVSIVSPIPLPVTGSTTISGTVAATQSGRWNVNVRNIDEPGRVPYASHTEFGKTTISCFPDAACTLSGFAAVPAGKRLVIQDFSGQIIEPAGCKPDTVTINGSTFVYAVFQPAPAFPDTYNFHESVLNFVDGGSAPTVSINSSCAGLNGDVQQVAIVGYLVSLP
jgi:hypothetical protein